jgi:flagellar motor switch protein FliN/FliY
MSDEEKMDLPEDEQSSEDQADQPLDAAGGDDPGAAGGGGADVPDDADSEAPPDDAGAADAGDAPEAAGDERSQEQIDADEAALAAAVAAEGEKAEDDDGVVNDDDVPEEDAEAAMLAMLDDLPQDESGTPPDDIDFGGTDVSDAKFQQLSQPAGSGETRSIEMLLDVSLPISIELGRTRMAIADILALGPGSVVELSKLAGEPVDLMVNQKIVAKGEVVVIDENFGVRITQLVTPEERLKILGEM